MNGKVWAKVAAAALCGVVAIRNVASSDWIIAVFCALGSAAWLYLAIDDRSNRKPS